VSTQLSSAAVLLERVILCTQTRQDARALLHERVVLERLDGEVLRGRDVVAEAISTRDADSTLSVIEHDGDDGVRVRLQLHAMGGELRFVIRAVAEHGVILAIVMEP
jgi:hypothetical protein